MTDRTLRPRITAEPVTDPQGTPGVTLARTRPATERLDARTWFHRSGPQSDVAVLVRSLYGGPSLDHRLEPTSTSQRSVAVPVPRTPIDWSPTGPAIPAQADPTTAVSLPTRPEDRLVDLRVAFTDQPSTDQPSTDQPSTDKQSTDQQSTEALLARRLRSAEFVVLPNNDLGYRMVKRAIDVIGAIVLLICSLPLFALLVLIIRLDSPGPAIFRQTRVTRNGRHFTFLKFRTMYVDARARFPDYYRFDAADDRGDVFYKLADDPRNTRVGRWLRRTTLDELPNLLNVLMGDISLVGPRPDLPELVPFYSDLELSCLLTKAGITGCAQTRGRSLLTMKERLRVDLFYVSHQSTWLDCKLMIRTVLVVLLGRGAF